MSIINDEIDMLINKGILVEIYRDNLNTDTIVSVIQSSTKLLTCLSTYNDDYMQYDGVSIIRNIDITRLCWDSSRLRSMEKLIDSDHVDGKINPTIDFACMRSIVESIQKNYGYVTLYIEDIDPDVCFIGEILKIDDTHIMMDTYGTMATRDRSKLVLSLDEISRVSAGGIYENNLMRLFT